MEFSMEFSEAWFCTVLMVYPKMFGYNIVRYESSSKYIQPRYNAIELSLQNTVKQPYAHCTS